MTAWDAARACAFVALAAYTLAICWGILLSARAWRPAAAQLVFHRFLSMLGLVAVCIHVSLLFTDRYARLSWKSLIGVDHRVGVVAGAVALWLVVVLPLTFRLRTRKLISHRTWKAIHYLGYAAWGLAVIHGVLTGSDTRSPYALGVYGGAVALVCASAWWRWSPPAQTAARRRLVADGDAGAR